MRKLASSPQPRSDTRQTAAIKDWVADVFSLSRETHIAVAEIHRPGISGKAVETVIVVNRVSGSTVEHIIPKAAGDVRYGDIVRLAGAHY